jgi:hypothetical protein
MWVGVTSPPLCALKSSECAVGFFRLVKSLDLGLAVPSDPPQLRISEAPPNSVG